MAFVLAACASQDTGSTTAETPAAAPAAITEEASMPADDETASDESSDNPPETTIEEPTPSPEPTAEAPTPADGATVTVAAEEETPGPTDGDSRPGIEECPQATDDSQLLYNPNHGYCLLYPAQYKVEKPNPEETVLVIGGLLNAADPRASINVTPIDGRSAVEVAESLAAEFAAIGDVALEEIGLDGEPAVLLDGLPGQDTNRRLIAVHDDQLYNLLFSPLGEPTGDGTESLSQQVVDSFTFIERAPGEFDECLPANDETWLLRHEEHGYCLLLPADYQSERPNPAETVVYVESLLNAKRPRLFIEMSEAEGKTVVQAAEELIATLPPGFERSFGVTIGYEIAEQFDNVPGQDISRVVLVVHDGRMYKLTFVPASQDAGEAYDEMERLYDLAVRSFRYLP